MLPAPLPNLINSAEYGEFNNEEETLNVCGLP